MSSSFSNGGESSSEQKTVYIGNIDPNCSSDAIKAYIMSKGLNVVSVKIINKAVNGEMCSAGYGFATFASQDDAQTCIVDMNETEVPSFPGSIKVNWASQKPGARNPAFMRKSDFDSVYKATGPNNRTIYLGNISPEIYSEVLETIRKTANPIDEKVSAEKGYGFLTFDSKDAACRVITNLTGKSFDNKVINVNWSNERKKTGMPGTTNMGFNSLAAASSPYAYGAANMGATGAATGAVSAASNPQAMMIQQQMLAYQMMQNPQYAQYYQQMQKQAAGAAQTSQVTASNGAAAVNPYQAQQQKSAMTPGMMPQAAAMQNAYWNQAGGANPAAAISINPYTQAKM